MFVHSIDGTESRTLEEALTLPDGGAWVTTGLAYGLRRIRSAEQLVKGLRGRVDRLTATGRNGATICDATCYGGNGREDIPAILAASAALGQPGKRLSSAICRALPEAKGRTIEARTWAHCGLPSARLESAGPVAAVEDNGDKWSAAERWAQLVVTLTEHRTPRPGSEEEREWQAILGPRETKRGLAGLRLGGGILEPIAGARVLIRPHVSHVDMSSAYTAWLQGNELRRCQPIFRPVGYHRPGGDVTGLIPGSRPPPGALRYEREGGPDFALVETAPARRLTDAVARIIETCEAAGGKAARRAAGRILYGLFHGSLTARSWRILADMPAGAYRTLAGRVLVERPCGLNPFAEPATAAACLDDVGEQLRVAGDVLRLAGHDVISEDTDGLIVAGPRDPMIDLGLQSWPAWVTWRKKWRGALAFLSPRHYLGSGCGVVWAGCPSASWRYRRLHGLLNDTLDNDPRSCAQ